MKPGGCDIPVFGAPTPYVRVAHFFEGTDTVWELVKSGGWMMLPIILSSIAAMAIVAERLWTPVSYTHLTLPTKA